MARGAELRRRMFCEGLFVLWATISTSMFAIRILGFGADCGWIMRIMRGKAGSSASKNRKEVSDRTVTFEPTTSDLELIASLSHARTPPDKIAAFLGISEPEYSAWLQRLAMGRAYVPAMVIPPRPERKVPERLRVRAERCFESVSAPVADAGEVEAAARRYSV